jgi:hypothetical protein
MSRIDNATLIVQTKAASAAGIANVADENTTLSTGTGLTNLLVFAESFNVLRILSGMGGLEEFCWAEKQRAENMHSLFSEKSLRPVHLKVSC